MNSYERVMACFEGEKPDRAPALPWVREWCCKQAGVEFIETMQSAGKHVYAQYYCVRKYGYDAVYDLHGVHAESEAMGSVLKFDKEITPMVVENAVKDYGEDLPKLRIPNPYKDGRLPLILEGISRLKELCDGKIPVVAYVQCPFRHAAMLRGVDDLLRDLFKNKEGARKLLEIATDSQIVWGTAVAQAGADIVVLSDPTSSGDMVSPKTYREWGLPYTQRVAAAVGKTGAKLILHICGDTTDRLEMLASTGVDALSLDSKVDFSRAREILGPDYLLMGNIEPTFPLALGTPEDVYGQTKKVIEQAGKDGRLLVSGGCSISAHAPEENVEAMLKAAYETVY